MWRCFHCDEVFTTRQDAYDHFGPDEGCEKLPPACIDPLRLDEKGRMKELRDSQDWALKCNQNLMACEDSMDILVRELAGVKEITGCDSLIELRNWMDSNQGRVVTANALIEGFKKADPELAARIIG